MGIRQHPIGEECNDRASHHEFAYKQHDDERDYEINDVRYYPCIHIYYHDYIFS